MSILERAKQVFLTDVDEETRQENAEELARWEKELLDNEALADWQQHDVTKKLLVKAKHEYIDASMQLANNRFLAESARMSLFAKKDACALVFELAGGDASEQIKQLEREMRQRISLAGG